VKTHNALASFATGALVLFLGLIACTSDVAGPYFPPVVAIQMSTPSAELLAGDRVSIGVLLTRFNFTGPVTLDVSGLPATASVDVSSNPVTGDSAILDIRLGEGVTPGTYSLNLSASSVGVTTTNARFELRVISSGTSTVTVPYCPSLAPTWVAFQDGNGLWTRATGVPSGGQILFRHQFAATRGAIATVTTTPGDVSTVLRVLYGSPAELTDAGDTLRVDCESVSSRTWRGHVDGLDASEKAFVSTGALLKKSVLPTAPDFEFIGVPLEPQDMLVTHLAQLAGETTITGFILRRGVDIADGGQLPSFDFASAEEFAPTTAALTIEGAGGSGVTSLTELRTSRNSLALPLISGQTAGTQTYYALPTAALQSGDIQQLHVSTDDADNSSRTMDLFFRQAVDRTITLGALLTPPIFDTDPYWPSPLLRARFGALADYDQSASLVFLQSHGGAIVSVSMTSSYVGLPGSGFELTVPDLATVSGFQENWTLRPGESLIWTATRTGGTVPLGRNAVPAVGAFRRTASLRGTLGAP